MFKYDSYLTQQKLKILLKDIFKKDFIDSEVNVPKTRMRWDFLIKNHNYLTVIEFDGDQHYRDSLIIMRDKLKDEIAKNLNYKTIRIPYFIQLDNQMFNYYFNKDIDLHRNFNHGFIKTKIFPASFCKLGIERYNSEIEKLPDNVKEEIKISLHIQKLKYGSEYVHI